VPGNGDGDGSNSGGNDGGPPAEVTPSSTVPDLPDNANAGSKP
jgi:hypothetical protein